MKQVSHVSMRRCAGLIAVLGLAAPLSFAGAVGAPPHDPTNLRPAARQQPTAAGSRLPAGHPAFDAAPFADRSDFFPGLPRHAPRGTPTVPLPTLSPIATGPFVNFESPPVKPLAVSSSGALLFAVNTPSGELEIIDTNFGPSGLLRSIARVPVGLDPVSVAIQPGTNDAVVWTANFIGDDVSVVDVTAVASGAAPRVLGVIDVGDEPVNILFSADGRFAYVVLQGPAAGLPPPFSQDSYLVTIDTQSRQVIHRLALDCHTARAAVIDHARQRLVIAALFSGNNTTVVGERIFRDMGSGEGDLITAVEAVKQFSATAALFAASPSIAPMPDFSPLPGAPIVPRIVGDAGSNDQWQQIIDILSLDDGTPDPAMVDLYTEETGVVNAHDVLQKIIDDAKDTADHDLIVVSLASPNAPAVERVIGDVGTILTGLALRPGDDRLFISNLNPRNTTRLEPNLRGHFIDHQIKVLDAYDTDSPTLLSADLHVGIAGYNNVTVVNPAAQSASLANPTDIVFRASGTQAFVAALGPDRVGVLNGLTARVGSRVDVARGPRALAIDDARNRLYVFSRTDHAITTLDITNAQPVVHDTYRLFNPEPGIIKQGRNFLYSTRFSNNFASSCATCHIDSNMDHIAWDLGDPHATAMQPGPDNVALATGVMFPNHPLKGPMVTLALRGLDRHNAFHWRSDKPQFTDFAPTFDKLLGGQTMPFHDMQKFEQFIKTVEYAPNPFWTRDNAIKDPAAFPNGAVVFFDNCNGCHSVNHDGTLREPQFSNDSGLNLDGLFFQTQEITQLRGLHKKFPSDRFTGFGLVHSGIEEREADDHPMQTFFKTFFRNLNAQQRSDAIAFLTAFPGQGTNVLGWQIRLDATADTADVLAQFSVMLAQHAAVPSRCDIIAKGIIAGDPVGYRLIDAAQSPPVFENDRGETLDLDALVELAQASGHLIFLAVPPGSGTRLGTDRDQDGLADGFDSLPYATADVNSDGVINSQDFFDFLAEFFSGSALADFNDDRDTNSQDFFDFISQFFESLS